MEFQDLPVGQLLGQGTALELRSACTPLFFSLPVYNDHMFTLCKIEAYWFLMDRTTWCKVQVFLPRPQVKDSPQPCCRLELRGESQFRGPSVLRV